MIAFGRWTHGLWENYCPPCWLKVSLWAQADAEILSTNGDIINCSGCNRVIGSGVCAHCEDYITVNPEDAEEYVDRDDDERPEPGQWCHVSTGGVWCWNDNGTKANPRGK